MEIWLEVNVCCGTQGGLFQGFEQTFAKRSKLLQNAANFCKMAQTFAKRSKVLQSAAKSSKQRASEPGTKNRSSAQNTRITISRLLNMQMSRGTIIIHHVSLYYVVLVSSLSRI